MYKEISQKQLHDSVEEKFYGCRKVTISNEMLRTQLNVYGKENTRKLSKTR